MLSNDRTIEILTSAGIKVNELMLDGQVGTEEWAKCLIENNERLIQSLTSEGANTWKK